MENLYSSQIEKIKNQNEEEKRKIEEKLNKTTDIEKIKNEKELIIKNLKDKISSFDSQIKSKEDIINKLKLENETSKKNNLSLKKKCKSDIDNLESKNREEINRINFQHNLEINEIQVKLDSQISKLKIENLQLKENYEKLLKSKNLLNDNLSQSKKDLYDNNILTEENFENNNLNIHHKSIYIKYNNNNELNKQKNNRNNSNNISTPVTNVQRRKLLPVKNTSIRLNKIIINANLKNKN